jgi:hypothetical protein
MGITELLTQEQTYITDTRADIADTRADIADTRADIADTRRYSQTSLRQTSRDPQNLFSSSEVLISI